MEENDKQSKIIFSRKGAWLGLIAYIVLVAIVAAVYLFG